MLLFIGISSFVGQNFSKSYRGELIGTYNRADFSGIPGDNASFKRLDIRDFRQVSELFNTNRITEVVLASSVIYSRNKKAFFDTNVAGTLNVIKAMKASGVKRIIYLSTAVLENDKSVWGEYGRSKDSAERLIVGSGLDYSILRPAEIYGPYGHQGLGKLINLIKKCKIIPIADGGKNEFTPVHVEDVCEIIKICLSQEIYDKGVYLLSGGQKITLRGFIRAVAEKLGRRIFLLDVPMGLIGIILKIAPGMADSEQISRAANTIAFMPEKAEARFGFKFRKIDLSYLDQPKQSTIAP